MTSSDTKSRKGTVAAAVLLAVVLVAIGSVVSSYPAACAACHAPQAKALASSGHHAVACYDCHLPAGGWSIVEAKADELFSMYPAFLLRRSPSGSGVRISRSACVACHRKILVGVVSAKGLQVSHSTCAPSPAKCDECHSDSAHGTAVRWKRQSNMDECVACHVSRKAPTACDACHSRKIRLTGSPGGSLRVTHGPDWKSTHGLGDLRTCAACHGNDSCVRCHGTAVPHPESFISVHGEEAIRPTAKCSTCHADTSACDSCHGIQMPHPKDFRPQHMKIATSRRDPKCLNCHTDFDCDNCHTGHAHPGNTKGTLGSQKLPSSKSVK